MNSIDMLIAMKTKQNADDLSVLFDEVIKYEKLAKTPALADIKNNSVVQKKLPLLTQAVNNDLYSIALLQTVNNVLLQVGTQLPGVLPNLLGDLPKNIYQRIEILGTSLLSVHYWDLTAYSVAEKDDVLMTLVDDERKTDRSIAIITYKDGEYDIYQGILRMQDSVVLENPDSAYTTVSENAQLTITNYSLLGNNAYRFGVVTYDGNPYDIMMPEHDMIWLLQNDQIVKTINLEMADINRLNYVKADIAPWADCLLEIIVKGVAA